MNLLLDIPGATTKATWPYYGTASANGISPASAWSAPAGAIAVQAAALGAGVPICVATKTASGAYATGPTNVLTVVGEDPNGNPLSDTLELTLSGGGEVQTTVHAYALVSAIEIPAEPNDLGEFLLFNLPEVTYSTSLTNVVVVQIRAGSPPSSVTSSSPITTIIDPTLMVLAGKLTLTSQALTGAWKNPSSVLVAGKDVYGKFVSETLTFTAVNGGQALTTANAYQRVGQIVLPPQPGGGIPVVAPTMQVTAPALGFPIAPPAYVASGNYVHTIR